MATNYILDVKKSAVEHLHMNFEQLAEDITAGLSHAAPPGAEQSLLVEEVKIGCSMGMLQCLDREHRLAYILGEILEMQGPEAAEILQISPELFPKRLQFARSAMMRFMKSYCALVSDAAPCRCNGQIPAGLAKRVATTQQLPSRLSRPGLWCGKWKRRDGSCRCTAATTRVPPRLTLSDDCFRQWIFTRYLVQPCDAVQNEFHRCAARKRNAYRLCVSAEIAKSHFALL